MQKCPPAESCRDAFERMSKATVQMCLATPGFGLSNEPRNENFAHHPLSRQSTMRSQERAQQPHYEPMQIDPAIQSPPPARSTHRPIQKKRPPPKFDMDLRDLFPEDLEASSRPSYSIPQPLPGLSRPTTSPPQPHQCSPLGLNLPPMQTSPLAHHPSPAGSINSQTNNRLGMGPSPDSNLHIFTPPPQQQQQNSFFLHNTYNPDFMSTLPGMDFLNNNAATAGDGEYNFDDASFDFRYGMTGLDPQHDWSDGQGFDLFDGFFFGNGSSGNSGGSV
jgi:hypothetical protein